MTALSAERLGREPSDPDVRYAMGALFGTLLVAAFDWLKDPETAFGPVVDEAVDRLQAGILL